MTGHGMKPPQNFKNCRRRHSQSGFSLLEIIIVIALVGFVYSVAIPNFNLKTGTEVANRLGRLNQDIRSAFDMAILRAKPVRLVFHLASGEYWLEVTDEKNVFMGEAKVLADPTKEDLEDRAGEFEADFETYVELAEQSYVDPENDKEIKTSSPVLKAKQKLKGPKWYRFDSVEWNNRSLGDAIGLKSIQAAHHERPITLQDIGPDALAYLYFLPSGFVEKAVLHIFYKIDEFRYDLETPPYTLITKPYRGVGELLAGYHEVDVHTLEEDGSSE